MFYDLTDNAHTCFCGFIVVYHSPLHLRSVNHPFIHLNIHSFIHIAVFFAVCLDTYVPVFCVDVSGQVVVSNGLERSCFVDECYFEGIWFFFFFFFSERRIRRGIEKGILLQGIACIISFRAKTSMCNCFLNIKAFPRWARCGKTRRESPANVAFTPSAKWMFAFCWFTPARWVAPTNNAFVSS